MARDVTAGRRCRVCSLALPTDALLQFNNMPGMAQHFPDARSVAQDRGEPLDIYQCLGCGLVQTVNDPVPYFRDVVRAAAYSKEMAHFRLGQFEDLARRHHLAGKRILEVGCGRGEYLRLLKAAGMNAIGLEHDPVAVRHCHDQGLDAIEGYIDREDYRLSGAPFDAFCSFNFLEHWPWPNATLAGIRQNLTHDAIGVVEVPNFDLIMESGLFAEFVRDHIFYFTAETLENTLRFNGFELLECSVVWHRYILSAVIRRRRPCNVTRLRNAASRLRKEVERFLESYAPQEVAIWGAGHQALALIALLDLGARVRYVVDSAPFKQDRYTPATHLPIVAPAQLKEDAISAVIVMAASYSDEVAEILRRDFADVSRIAVVRDTGLDILA